MEGQGRERARLRRRKADRRGRPALFPPDRGRDAAGRRLEGAQEARLDAEGPLPRARRRDDARGPEGRGARRAGEEARLRRLRLPRVMKVYVAGHRGMVGSAIVRALGRRGYLDVVTRTHAELDLADQHAVRDFFSREKPGHVVLAAAKVGGIHANNTYPAEFIYENLMMEANVVHEAYRAGVKKLLSLG